MKTKVAVTGGEQEFTAFNAVAFDLARREAAKTNTKIPCWLCSSDICKKNMQEAAVKELNERLFEQMIVPLTLETAPRFCESTGIGPLVAKWRLAELDAKEQRDKGNIQAFFV